MLLVTYLLIYLLTFPATESITAIISQIAVAFCGTKLYCLVIEAFV